MFYARGTDVIDVIDELPEKAPLLHPATPSTFEEYEHRHDQSWKRYVQVELKVPKPQTIAGVLLGILLLGMVLMLVAEAIRESREPDPFLIDYATTPKPFQNLMSRQSKGLKDAWLEGEGLVAYRKNLEKMLVENGILPAKLTPSSQLQRFQRGAASIQGQESCGIIVEHMKKVLGGCIDTDLLPDHCQPEIPTSCNASSPYRTFNGSCNNLEHPGWGMALTAYKRLMRADYADGVSLPRISKSGDELPNARYLSNELYTHRSKPRCNHTVLTLYFGLFIDHDIINLASKTGHNGAPISCCHPDIAEKPSLLHPECMAIRIPRDDPFYSPLGVKCLDFVRSATVPGDCPGEREQSNLVTSFLDGSGVYGSFDNKNAFLRSHKDGQLRVCYVNKTEMLPPAHHISYECGFPNRDLFCFRAGDMRVNEQVELTTIHTLWMREHNRIASRFHSLNPQWDDERLFQEARRLVVAELQHIVYNEFLPALLGEQAVEDYGLKVDPKKGYLGYDPKINPSIVNVFGAAAFRVGHSLIEGMIDLIGPGYTSERQIPLHKVFLNPDILYEKGIDKLVRGLVRERAATVDSYITDEVRNRLFQPHNGHYGLDLAAIGIQRGRDHGVPGYSKWRKFCNLSEVNTWEDLFQAMDSEHAQRLRKVYDSVEDIDLEPAALSENHIPGALVGPTHACLIAGQFRHTRLGDRFWFEVQNQPGSFKPGQLEEIYKSSMARLLCDNSDNLAGVQRFALKALSKGNPEVMCSEIPKVDLKVWTE